MGITDKATVAVLADVKRQRRVGIIMKGAKRFVMMDRQPESVCNALYGQVLEFLNVNLVKHTR